MVPSVGRTVHLRLSDAQVGQINRRRQASIDVGGSGPEPQYDKLFSGNSVTSGDIFPLLITKIWSASPDETTPVNGQVFLDGDDSLWVTSATQGELAGQWFEPPRVA